MLDLFGMEEMYILGVSLVFTVFGYFVGRKDGIDSGASGMIQLLEDSGFLKVKQRRTDPSTGEQIVEYSKVDE